jgi:phage-related protein
MTYPLKVIILETVELFREKLLEQDKAKLNGSITAIRYGNFNTIYIKTLKWNIKELRIKKIRLIFFIKDETVYFVDIFIKKTNKTPKQEIEKAEKIYKLI